MPLKDARRFVVRMREDHDFRRRAMASSGPEDLPAFLASEGYVFDQGELIVAMAECMMQLERQMGG